MQDIVKDALENAEQEKEAREPSNDALRPDADTPDEDDPVVVTVDDDPEDTDVFGVDDGDTDFDFGFDDEPENADDRLQEVADDFAATIRDEILHHPSLSFIGTANVYGDDEPIVNHYDDAIDAVNTVLPHHDEVDGVIVDFTDNGFSLKLFAGLPRDMDTLERENQHIKLQGKYRNDEGKEVVEYFVWV